MLDGVYHPERLEVLNGCKRLGGTVLLVRGEEDGDLHFDVELDRRYRRVLLPGNFGQQHGALVVEFMARDGGHLPAPAAGNRVDMVGALVNDTQHHWAELHPVWAVRINGGRWSRSGPRFGGSPAQDRSTTPRGTAGRPPGRPAAATAPARQAPTSPGGEGITGLGRGVGRAAAVSPATAPACPPPAISTARTSRPTRSRSASPAAILRPRP